MKIQLLEKKHNKASFDSETPLLDNYITKQASQDVKKHLTAVYVLSDETDKVMGYYTLSSSSIPMENMPEDLIKKFPPSYTNLPVVLLGRLAVDKDSKKNGYGPHLLMDAMERTLALSTQLGVLALVVDPLHQKAAGFYARYGFITIPNTGKMFISIETIRKSL